MDTMTEEQKTELLALTEQLHQRRRDLREASVAFHSADRARESAKDAVFHAENAISIFHHKVITGREPGDFE